jgi:arsenite methyltransferase
MNKAIAAPRPNYGIDAPKDLRQFLLIGLGGIISGFLVYFISRRFGVPLLRYLAPPLVFMGVAFLVTAAIMLWGSLVRKFHLRDEAIAAIPWRGDETVLDVGCGHGLLLIAAAKHLTSGKAIGIDIWSQRDQAFNSPEAVLRNARLEGVSERTEIRKGDARALAIPDETIDVVLSSWALHNIEEPSGREQALHEIVRVLKPGGRVVLLDISYPQQYAEILKRFGMCDIQISRPDYMFVVPTQRVTAIKDCGEKVETVVETGI